MPGHKQLCKTCKVRHLPPTGKKCQRKKSQPHSDNELLRDAAAAEHSSATQPQGTYEGGQQLQLEILAQKRFKAQFKSVSGTSCDGVRYIMRQKGFTIIDYIDDYVGMGVPSVASASYVVLIDLMGRLGLSISQNKLVPPRHK